MPAQIKLGIFVTANSMNITGIILGNLGAKVAIKNFRILSSSTAFL